MQKANRLVYLGTFLCVGIGIVEIGEFLAEHFATIVWGCEPLDESCIGFAQELHTGAMYLLFGLAFALLGVFDSSSRKVLTWLRAGGWHIGIYVILFVATSLWSFHRAYESFDGTIISSRESAHVDVMVLILSCWLVHSILIVSAGTLGRFLSRKFPYKS
ncbi:MAG TPA: hypothetical protein VE954_22165 [Oligoflexus sp.]|uniref:hypothetical protein n=1 Tax=Oligoflexus sp. TaxID=1971216 RepID=UPI002D6647C4|nr:hypothetical protein [Oligoflexus sp.]HYX35813.1 hypothetical protein [Oligoflexus sp.]